MHMYCTMTLVFRRRGRAARPKSRSWKCTVQYGLGTETGGEGGILARSELSTLLEVQTQASNAQTQTSKPQRYYLRPPRSCNQRRQQRLGLERRSTL